MKHLLFYLFLISLTLSIPFEAKTENEIVADLSQGNVEISTNFLGAKYYYLEPTMAKRVMI